ncbi:carboxypeptidase-like regulatory domain-containing protein [Pseudomonas sp. PH1b]|uniref:carboxypeptidase-like regulatory domain-containing protein n=1 Tax=Pseudomonas sp. PH1b TaxID=1397282 RepID=UPI000469CBB6|nr:carboxypeptidase-like regulatory domain-containing protein [Pseudomonas sp. PH1b]
MKSRLYMATGLALLACALSACAPRQGRTLDEYPPVKISTVQYPDAPFDTQAARAALQPGTATLTGKFCIVGNDGIEDSRDVKIYLYPVTPHLQAWHKLRSSQPEGAPVSMLPEAVAVHRVTRTNGNGIFQFTGLQPGRYFVQGQDMVYGTSRWNEYVGTGQSNTNYGPVTTHYYTERSSTSSYSGMLDDFVDIASGENKKLTMTNYPLLIPCRTW